MAHLQRFVSQEKHYQIGKDNCKETAVYRRRSTAALGMQCTRRGPKEAPAVVDTADVVSAVLDCRRLGCMAVKLFALLSDVAIALYFVGCKEVSCACVCLLMRAQRMIQACVANCAKAVRCT
jgi:hypothetical protein